MMLELAVRSGLPLVAIQTTDTVNIGVVLGHLLKKNKVVKLELTRIGGKVAISDKAIMLNRVYWLVYEELDWSKLYDVLVVKSSTLIIVNPKKTHEEMYDAGILTCPESLIGEFIKKYYDGDQYIQMIAAFKGLSYKEVIEITKMATVQHGNFTPRAVRDIRRKYFPSIAGIQQLSTNYLYYMPQEELVEWLKVDAKFIGSAPIPEFMPRGLLFSGKTGTGKTSGARYIANKLNLPLYMLDLGMILSKWVGDSEKNLRQGLNQVENCAPCVLLIDEVEKLFQQSSEGDVAVRLLASLLWWLAEHNSGVFTIMTTNNTGVLPTELYRKGRIDKEVKFRGVRPEDVKHFVESLLEKLAAVVDDTFEIQQWVLNYWECNYGSSEIAHSDLTDLVLGRAKQLYLDKLK